MGDMVRRHDRAIRTSELPRRTAACPSRRRRAYGTGNPPPAKAHSKIPAVIALIVVIAGGIFAGHYFGLLDLPFLTDTVNNVQGNDLAVLGAGELGTYDAGNQEQSPLAKDLWKDSGLRAVLGTGGVFQGIMETQVDLRNVEWTGSLPRTAADITDVVIYVDGTPHPVSINDFKEYKEKYYTVLFDAINKYPATYQVSFTVQGIEIAKEDLVGVVVYADQSYDWVFPTDKAK
jgi:hypothetical protein